jgi:glycosyltransferase involved in cell wall biosynthesis
MSSQLYACVVSQRAYPGDARLSTQIDALKEAGFAVDVIATRSKDKPFFSVENGVRTYRPPSVERKRASKLRYVVEYLSFLFSSFFLLSWMQFQRRYQLVFVTNLPDGLIFAATVSKLMGAKVLFDLRETTPEMFMDRFGGSDETTAVRVMSWIEKVAINFADGVTACTQQQKDAVVSRGAPASKISVMINVGSRELPLEPILPNPMEDTSSEFRIITHGTIIRRYGLDVLIRAMPHVLKEVPQARLEIIGKGEQKPELEKLVRDLGLEQSVSFAGFLPTDELVRRLRAAHIGAIPLIKNPESNLIHTHKMFEYIEMGIPIVISRTAATEAYFDDTCLSYFDSGDHVQMAEAIIDLAKNPQKRLSLARNALAQFADYEPEKQKAAFQRAVGRLVPLPHLQKPAPAQQVKEEVTL